MVQIDHRISAHLITLDSRVSRDQDVELAVIIAVEQSNSAAHGLDEVSFLVRSRWHCQQADIFADVAEMQATGGCCWSFLRKQQLRRSDKSKNAGAH